MDSIDFLADFDPLDALEQKIENEPMSGDVVFQDPLCQMLDKLEQSLETSGVKPPLVPEGPEVLQNPSQEYLPPQEQSREACSEQGTMDSAPLPYYIETPQRPAPFRTPPHRQGGRIGRRGGSSFNGTRPRRGDEIYCPVEKRVVTRDFCEDRDCEYYDEDSDRENGRYCTYHDGENL